MSPPTLQNNTKKKLTDFCSIYTMVIFLTYFYPEKQQKKAPPLVSFCLLKKFLKGFFILLIKQKEILCGASLLSFEKMLTGCRLGGFFFNHFRRSLPRKIATCMSCILRSVGCCPPYNSINVGSPVLEIPVIVSSLP